LGNPFFGSSYAASLARNVSIGYFLKIVSFSFLVSPFRTGSHDAAGVELRFRDLSFYSVIEEMAKGVSCAIAFLLSLA